MKTWHVWEAEYPEDGDVMIHAWTWKGAQRKWRQMTVTRGPVADYPPLDFEHHDDDCPCDEEGLL